MLNGVFRRFKADESGAVTTDWVVITAAVVGLGLVVATSIGGSTTEAAAGVATSVDSTVATALGHEQTTEEFLASYNPVSSRHRGGSGPDSWVRGSYDYTSRMSDSQLAASYARNYSKAMTGTNAVAADRLAVRERVMKERGMSVPSGNKSAAEVRKLYA